MKRVTVNLAPASVRKAGSGLELAVALALTCADGGLPVGALDGVGVLGELGLDGSVRPSPARSRSSTRSSRTGIEHVDRARRERGRGRARSRRARARRAHARRAARVLEGRSAVARPARSPAGDRRRARRRRAARPRRRARPRATRAMRSRSRPRARTTCCWSVRPASARRCSPAGCRRSCPARPRRRARGHPDPLRRRYAPRSRRCGSTRRSASRTTARRWSRSSAADSSRVRPGEVTLAHRGALFLDELPSSRCTRSKSLRQPLEERVVRISRASGTIEFPADFLLVACANPCPCGRERRNVPLQRRAADALRPPALGAAARSLRPAPHASRRRAPSRASRRDVVAARVAARSPGSGPGSGHAVAAQRPHPGRAALERYVRARPTMPAHARGWMQCRGRGS